MLGLLFRRQIFDVFGGGGTCGHFKKVLTGDVLRANGPEAKVRYYFECATGKRWPEVTNLPWLTAPNDDARCPTVALSLDGYCEELKMAFEYHGHHHFNAPTTTELKAATKHLSSTNQDIAKKDPKYLEWIMTQEFSDEVKGLVEEALKGQFPAFDATVKK